MFERASGTFWENGLPARSRLAGLHPPFLTGKMPSPVPLGLFWNCGIKALWHFAIMESLPSIPQSHNLTIPHLQNPTIPLMALVIQCKAPDMRASEWNILGERASSPFTIGAAHLPFRTGKMPVSQYRPRYSEIMAFWHFAIMESPPSIPQSHNSTFAEFHNQGETFSTCLLLPM